MSWFYEKNDLWPGQALSIEFDEILKDCQSKYQHIQVYKTKNYGKMLILDGIIQFTERDEFSYQEMMTHVPLFVHPKPKKILVIGGGDGGIVRELIKHNVDSITLCEIDEEVINVSKEFFWNIIKDGVEFLKENKNMFDIIITDSSDPIGPAINLYNEEYLKLVSESLKDDGIMMMQAQTVWLHSDFIKNLYDLSKEIFGHVKYGLIQVPTYPCGQIGFIIASKSHYHFTEKRISSLHTHNKIPDLKYYNWETHMGAFYLPEFVKKILY
jgi:spermidine synthase